MNRASERNSVGSILQQKIGYKSIRAEGNYETL